MIFKNCKVTDVFRSDTSNVASTKDQSVLVKMSFEEFIIDFEVLEVKFQRSFDKKKIYKIFGQCAYENNSDFGEFTISFDSVDIDWSDLTEDSWFVGFGE
ncbi:hypothetical protein [Fusibacter sp. JL216-2]|uniref:hypothetical protein n=1 Tax=Fusibacter sp. JL216-2 TaxID=3071453 RepID=UPI003D33BE39